MSQANSAIAGPLALITTGPEHDNTTHSEASLKESRSPSPGASRGIYSQPWRGTKAFDPGYTRSNRWRNAAYASPSLWSRLDRVQVLGGRNGHSGCVNALCWSSSGDSLISSGDDCRICMWRQNTEGDPTSPSNASSSTEPSFHCTTVIPTGHRGNIFSAQFLPYTNDTIIATCSADKQIRVFDITRASGAMPRRGDRTQNDTLIKTLKCHKGRVKRIFTQHTPHTFLTVSEDHTVRQHDLRTPHQCGNSGCPTPLVRLPYSLSTLSCSSLTPFYFVVAGQSAFGHLFDLRMVGRILKSEWGAELTKDDDLALAKCVRRFGRLEVESHENKASSHVTGSRMSKSNGHELLLSYSSDAAYLYTIRDQPTERPAGSPTILGANKVHETKPKRVSDSGSVDVEMPRLIDPESEDTDMPQLQSASESSESDEEEEDKEAYDPWARDQNKSLNVPVVFPRKRFYGACNVETVKDVNFLGPNDEWITSGSDDGNFFIWSKLTGKLQGIWEGDGGVVNVVEERPPHHSYPMLAVSGLDHDVKLFAPTRGRRSFARISEADNIMRANRESAHQSSRITTFQVAALYASLQAARRARGVTRTEGEEDEECRVM